MNGVCIARYASGADISVTVDGDLGIPGVQTITQPTLLRIYDATTTPGGALPTNSIGSITIDGTIDTEDADARLDLAIVGRNCSIADPGFDFAESPLTPITARGAYILGNSNGGISILNSALGRRTRLVAAVVEDIFGDIYVGHVYRIQAGRFQTIEPSGLISANITTSADDMTDIFDGPGGANRLSIEAIACNEGITGTIRANGYEGSTDVGSPIGNTTYASIRQIRIGPFYDPNAATDPNSVAGLKGWVQAPNGYIREIFTTAPIGDNAYSSVIEAADGIFHVRAVDENGDLYDVDFNLNQTAAGVLPFTTYTPTGVPKNDGAIQLIETLGDIRGYIRAGNIARGNTPGSGDLADTGRAGIYSHGSITATIHIDYVVQGNIVGAALENTILIGRTMEGSILGWDFQSGAITEDIQIGMGEEPDITYVNNWPPALRGTNQTPYPRVRDANWVQGVYDDAGLAQGGNYSVIALPFIKDLTVREVTVTDYGSTQFANRPLIEIPHIDHLKIGSLREGSVWSGVMDPGTTPPDTENDNRSDDYAVIGDVEIGCIGANGDIWATGFLAGFSIAGNMLGEIAVPSMSNQQLIRIGGALSPDDGDDTEGFQCTCTIEPTTEQMWPGCGYFWHNSPDGEPAPRDEAPAAFGAVRIALEAGLQGQVIVDADNETGAHRPAYWQGAVVVGDGTSGELILSTNSSLATNADTLGPAYNVLPDDLGGGAVGLAPFAVHRASSDALNTADGGINSSNFNRVSPCTEHRASVDFYGPIQMFEGPSDYFAAYYLRHADSGLGNWAAAMSSVITGPFGRTLTFRTEDPYVAPSGDYEFTTQPTTVNSYILCHTGYTPGQRVLPVATPYEFTVELDCDYDCDADGGTPCTIPWVLCDTIDFNRDGLYPDNLDLQDFVDVFGGGACSNDPNCGDLDFNNDGLFPDNTDIEAIFRVFGGGDCLQ